MNAPAELPLAVTEPPKAKRTRKAPAPVDTSPAGMMLRAMERGFSYEQIQQLMDTQQRFEERDAEKAFNAAFARFSSEDVTVLKDKTRTTGPLAGRKYATLYAFNNAAKAALARHGFGVRWTLTRDEPEWIEVTCILSHEGGHSVGTPMGGPPDIGPDRNMLQARKSTVSYLERTTLKAACGLAEKEDDDDGAGGATPPPEAETENDPDKALTAGRAASKQGAKALTDWWAKLGAKDRSRLARDFAQFRKTAAGVDANGGAQ